MELNPIIVEKTKFLFGCDFNDPAFDADESYEHSDVADEIIKEYGWKEVFPCWFQFLKENCKTPEEVLNYANLFYYYGGTDYPIRDPYSFVSYFYYRIDITQYGAQATNILDSIVIPILSRIGDVNLEKNPNYAPESDPKIITAIEEWKEKEA